MQHMVDAVVRSRLFDGSNVCRLFHHAHQALVARRAGTVAAWINISDVVADRAEVELFLEVLDGPGESFGILSTGPQNMECQALRALAPHTGQFFQFVNQLSHWLGKFGHLLT